MCRAVDLGLFSTLVAVEAKGHGVLARLAFNSLKLAANRPRSVGSSKFALLSGPRHATNLVCKL